MNKPLQIGTLASTNGTILPAILEYEYRFPLEFSVFITNKADCGAQKKAEKGGIPSFVIEKKGREEWDQEAVNILKEHDIDLVLLVGFMRILSPVFTNAFERRILNVHPSLLPKFAGGMNTDVHQAVLDAGEKESGATIHLVTDALDEGPIFLQRSVAIEAGETVDSLKNKVQNIEKAIFPEAIEQFYREYFL